MPADLLCNTPGLNKTLFRIATYAGLTVHRIMNTNQHWTAIDNPAPVRPADSELPLEALSRGEIPAVICRQAYSPDKCVDVVNTLVQEGHLFDPDQPVPTHLLDEAIPENYYYRPGETAGEKRDQQENQPAGRLRIDVGTSLGTRGSDPESFFSHAGQTQELFASLFEWEQSPVKAIYDQLSLLAPSKAVMTARESDGRLYGPAIFRAHYGGFTYRPHYDSVRNRERRTQFSVHEFEHQFAGVLVLQNTERDGVTAQSRLHRCFWSPEVDPHLENDTFHEFAERQEIPSVDIVLNPGDLYFFNTGCIHEVPGVAGDDARIVLATFIGYSSDRDEIFVWS